MRRYFIILQIQILIYSIAALSESPSKQNEKYLSQSYVDSSIGQAFYLLNEATTMAGVGFHQKEAIDGARRIAFNLKQLAKGDPNERYVLWKTSELEAQIYLEEKDLVLQQVQKGQISVNQLISRYNLEVGKVRPDFSSLKRIHMQISHLDTKKANEMAGSYNNRHRAISREVLFSLEKAIMSGDLKNARQELGYCLRNKIYLDIGDSKYSQLEQKVEGLTRSGEKKPFIEKDIQDARNAIKQFKLNVAREKISSASYLYSGIKNYLSQNESSSISSSIDLTSRYLTSKEDSLVQVNLTILKVKGVQAANDYLKNKLRPSGVSRDKAAYVDNAILSISSPDTSKIGREIGYMAEEDDSQSAAAFNDLLATAKRKAQAKMDSIRAIEDARWRELQIENARRDSMFLASQAEMQKFQDSATILSLQLYTMLEKNKTTQASTFFNQKRNFLCKYMWKDAFDILETTIKQSLNPPPAEKAVSVSYISNVPESTPAYSQDQILKANQQKAQDEILQLYNMLENNQINEAYSRFKKIRSPLQRYLDKEVFAMLETTVTEAYRALSW